MRCVLGLGNPERSFAASRQNLGLRLVEVLAERCGVSLRPRLYTRMGIADLDGQRVILAQPLDAIDDCAQAVRSLFKLFRLGARDFLIAVADPDLPLGNCDLGTHARWGRHTVVARITETLGEHSFVRLGLGIGPVPPGEEAGPFAVTPLRPEEEPLAEAMLVRAAQVVETWVGADVATALSRAGQ